MDVDVFMAVAAYAGAFVTIIGAITLIVKPLRNKLIQWVTKTSEKDIINRKIDNLTEMVQTTIDQNNKLQEETGKQSEALKASIRNSILNIYYKCMEKNNITTYELQNLTELYENYKSLGGNSFVGECVNRLMQLPLSGE